MNYKPRNNRWVVSAVLSMALIAIPTWAQTTFEQLPERAPSQPVGKAPPPDQVFQTLPDYQVEKLFTVPKDKLGSWVCMTVDPKGRLIVSDQGNQGLCRVTLPAIGSKDPVRVEKLPVKMSAAQGMLFAFDSLYVSVNGGQGSGLYRLRDTNGDDQFDEVKLLRSLRGGGEHGPHALRLSPDGKSIIIVCGNHTDPPEPLAHSTNPLPWGEDLLLPRHWDSRGHARGRMAPGGWIAKVDPEGKIWEVISSGFRNTYEIDFNADGELFAYDSDMEWDLGSPWYRPTRVMHATSGSEFGWRSGTGKWPTWYPDSLPELVNIGPGSPVGVTFGYGAKFPAKYQKALYICDWTFGTIYALHLTPKGSSYSCIKEEFLSRTPLPLTDAVVGPDGAMYFTIGGRGIASELYRVTYTGKESTAKADYKDAQNADLRQLRHDLEAFHRPGGDAAKAIALAIPNLKHEDRFIRYAARVTLEHQPLNQWKDLVLAEKDPTALINGAIALARKGGSANQADLLVALDKLDLAKLPVSEQTDLVRVYQLIFIRMGEASPEWAEKLAKKWDPLYPAASDALNRELVQLLVYVKSPTVLAKTIELMKKPSKPISRAEIDELIARNKGYGAAIEKMMKNAPDDQKTHYAFALRNVEKGWTMEQRKFFFEWLNEARQKSGGNSYIGFINFIDNDTYNLATDVERVAIEAAKLRKPYVPKELPKPKGPGKKWTTEEILKLIEKPLTGRNFVNGQKMYSAARCVVCHRFAGEGGATGPDLSQLAGRFNNKDLTEALIDPSKVISDQYKSLKITTLSGQTYAGRIVSDAGGVYTVLTDPEDSTKIVDIKKDDVESMVDSKVSMMPVGLLDGLSEREVLDLYAYMLSRGDPSHPMFAKQKKK